MAGMGSGDDRRAGETRPGQSGAACRRTPRDSGEGRRARIRLWLGQPALLLAAFTSASRLRWSTGQRQPHLRVGHAAHGQCVGRMVPACGAWRWGSACDWYPARAWPIPRRARAIDRADSHTDCCPPSRQPPSPFCQRHVWATAFWLIVIGLVSQVDRPEPCAATRADRRRPASFADSVRREPAASPEPVWRSWW
jgi:hypothetical protein